MNLLCLLSLGVGMPAMGTIPAQQGLRSGMVLDHSVKIARSSYRIDAPGDETGPGAIVVKGDGITIDFNHATLRGTPETVDPDQRKGVGVEVHGRNITIKNLTVRGYKVGLIARDCPGLKILDSDFSYNWKQHLHSTLEKEDESDWQSYHQNEKDEWLGYGAAIYLRNCDGFEIKAASAVDGQCGLMMTQCNDGLVWNNNFSFLSGIGIGLYRSSHNRIMHNKVDWCVRGYSEGVYNRGQDSAGILVYEQSNKNVFAYNSVTQGGDGFFLWAGQTTMDTGKGGCNDNLLFGNDWSSAPTNGIEATFSRNTFVNNLVLECWHGIWGGYSYDTKVLGNHFGMNGEGIAWEHGQKNLIEGNLFDRDTTGIDIWADPNVDPNWGYGKARDIASHAWIIRNNAFQSIPEVALAIRESTDVAMGPNGYSNTPHLVRAGKDVTGTNQFFRGATPGPLVTVDAGDVQKPPAMLMQPSGLLVQNLDLAKPAYLARFDTDWNPWSSFKYSSLAPKPLKGGIDPFIKKGQMRGRQYILVDQWGPYDFQSPLMWPRGEVGKSGGATIRRFEILGPKGSWRLVSASGIAHLSVDHGSVPGVVDVTLPAGKAGLTSVQLEYVGGRTTDYRGVSTPAGRAVRFGYSKFFAPIDWTVQWYSWDPAMYANPQHAMPSLTEVLGASIDRPLRVEKTDRVDYSWGGSPGAPVPADHFMTLAEGSFQIPKGSYRIEITCDDGARLYLDGKLLIDQWHYQGPTSYSADVDLSASQHQIRVEHYEIDGYSTLKVDLQPRR